MNQRGHGAPQPSEVEAVLVLATTRSRTRYECVIVLPPATSASSVGSNRKTWLYLGEGKNTVGCLTESIASLGQCQEDSWTSMSKP